MTTKGFVTFAQIAFETDLGWMAASWRNRKLCELTFGRTSARAALDGLNGELSHGTSSLLLDGPSGDITGILPQSAMSDAKGVFQACSANQGEVDPQQFAVAAELIDRLRAYAAGEPDNFLDIELDESQLTPFRLRVTNACRRVKYGRTASYADLARRVHSPRAARAVGGVMRTNRWPIIVPCHRILASGGSLGGYSAPDGLNMKRRLLAMEERGAERGAFASVGRV